MQYTTVTRQRAGNERVIEVHKMQNILGTEGNMCAYK